MLKTLDEYKTGNIEEALRKAFLKFDALLISEEARKELNLIAGNSEPNSDNEDKNVEKKKQDEQTEGAKVESEEEDNERNEVEKLYDEATMPLMDVLKRYTKTKKRVKKQLNANRVKLGLEPLKTNEGEESNDAVSETEGSSSKKVEEDGEKDEEDEDEDVNFNIEDIKMFKKFALDRIKRMANKKMKEDKGEKPEIKEEEEEGVEEEEKDDDDDEEEDGEEGEDEDYDEEDDDDDEEEGDDDEEDEVDEEEGLMEPQMEGGEVAKKIVVVFFKLNNFLFNSLDLIAVAQQL